MGLTIHQEKITPALGEKLQKLCPFGAISYGNGALSIGMGCKLCKLCVKQGGGAVTFEEDDAPQIDKSEYTGIVVFCEHYKGSIHAVTFELLGKARELAAVTGHKVMALMIGSHIREQARELFCYGADQVYVYDHAGLEDFLIEPYTNVFEDFIRRVKPSSILVGATNVGRSLAPRVAARIGTGLTADCTALEMTKDTDLVQIRPAFGGNIMAQIITANTRPQFATVRYKVMDAPKRRQEASGEIICRPLPKGVYVSPIRLISSRALPARKSISDADVLVVGGRGLKKQADLEMIKTLAELLGGDWAVSRPLVEKGWAGNDRQIGLSGRTVRPRLIITCGVSGAIQFASCMNMSERIVAINTDPDAPIFSVAHIAVAADLYEVVPDLIQKLKEGTP